MKFKVALFLAGVGCTVAAVVLLTPDYTREFPEPAFPALSESRHEPEPETPSPNRSAVSDPTPPAPILSTGSAAGLPMFTPVAPLAPFPISPSSRPPVMTVPPRPPIQTWSGSAAGDDAVASVEGIVVPLGTSLPASLVDRGESATPAQIDALDRIADDFVREIAAVPDGTARPTANSGGAAPVAQRPADWNTATQAANERYRQIFGHERYNAWTTEAAKEGLRERATAR